MLLRLLPILTLGCPVSHLLLLLVWSSLNYIAIHTSVLRASCPLDSCLLGLHLLRDAVGFCGFVGSIASPLGCGGSTLLCSCSCTLPAATGRLPYTLLVASMLLVKVEVLFVSFKQSEASGVSSIYSPQPIPSCISMTWTWMLDLAFDVELGILGRRRTLSC